MLRGEPLARSGQALLGLEQPEAGRARAGHPREPWLGLAQIVQHFGGTLWVESAPGKGSTFSFTLPLDAHPRGGTEAHDSAEVAQ